jgi:glycosyltransferase involved in cell wall biosynthesis
MGKSQPLVAIVIPVYNGEKYIEKCIKHIIA